MGLLAGLHLPFSPSGDYSGRQEINELPRWYKIACLPYSLNGLQTSKGVVIVMEGSGNNAGFAALQTSSPERERENRERGEDKGGGYWVETERKRESVDVNMVKSCV